MAEAIERMMGRLLGDRQSASRCDVRDLDVQIGPISGGYLLVVRKSAGIPTEREAVELAVEAHRWLDRSGTPIEPEMLAYRGPGDSLCFQLATESARVP